MVAGLQDPEMPLGEVAFKAGAVAPVHKASVDAKFGTVCVVIETTVLAEVAHWPEFGVNTYVFPVVLLMAAGFQVPEMPLGEVAFKVGAAAPVHKDKVVAKLGVMELDTVTTVLTEVAHWPAFGVNT